VLPSWAQLQKSSGSTPDNHIASYCKQIEQFRYNGFQQLVVAIHSYISMLPCARQSRRDGDGPTAGMVADNGDALTRAVPCGIARPPMATPRSDGGQRPRQRAREIELTTRGHNFSFTSRPPARKILCSTSLSGMGLRKRRASPADAGGVVTRMFFTLAFAERGEVQEQCGCTNVGTELTLPITEPTK
jgi:hypothetical protein